MLKKIKITNNELEKFSIMDLCNKIKKEFKIKEGNCNNLSYSEDIKNNCVYFILNKKWS